MSSDEYLNYAEQNRREWELNGKRVVSEMVAESAKLRHTEDAGTKSAPARSVERRGSSSSLINLKEMADEIGQGPESHLDNAQLLISNNHHAHRMRPLR